MNRTVACLLLLISLLAAPATAFSTPTYLGPGELGAIVRSGDMTEATGVLLVDSYRIDAGVTVNTPASGRLAIIATGAIEIYGTINGDGRGSAGGAAGATGTAGVGNGGSGASSATGATAGGAGDELAASALLFVMGGYSNSATGYQGAGGGGGRQATAAVNSGGGGGGGGGPCAPGGTGGAGGAVQATAGTAGTGGTGGAGLLLIADSITIGGSAVIDLDGGAGTAATGTPPVGSGGGAGASGGMAYLSARTITWIAGSSFTANGGNGGAGGGSGGPGAAGGTGGATGCNAGTAGGSPTNGGGGGGGGAGGLLAQAIDTSAAFMGTWSSSTTYSYGDLVTRNGLSYVAITTHTNQAPETNADDWTILGNSGFTAITITASEPAGANCAAGGQKVSHGLDNGDGGGVERDGTLQSGEVDSIAYTCNGATGATGADGADGDPGPIGITWQGQWLDTTTYAERDAVHYAGSAWYCFDAPCDDAPAPGSLEWDFIANADGNVVVPSSVDVASATVDFWIPILFWIAAALFFIYRDWAFSLAFTVPGLLEALFPYDIPGELAQWLLFAFLGVLMQYFVGDRQRFSLHGKKKSGV